MRTLAGVIFAGVAGGSAYLAAQALDIFLTKKNTDDRVLLGRVTPVPREQVALSGTVWHLVNSIVFAAAFRFVARDLMKGPMWWRATVFANIENTALYPLALFEDFHPAIRDGQLDSYQSWTAFAQETWRHVALGIAVGSLTPERD